MSAPAGWHLQPDGQERFWDGPQWTDQFRSPLPSDPTPPPSWAGPVDQTQAVDVDTHPGDPGTAGAAEPARAGQLPAGRVRAAGSAQPDYGSRATRSRLPAAGLPAAGLPAARLPADRLRRARHPALRPAAAAGRRPGQGLPDRRHHRGARCSAPPSSAASTCSTGPPTRSARPSPRPAHRPAERLPVRACPPRAWASRSTSPSVTASSCPAPPSSRAGRWTPQGGVASSTSPG